MRRLATALLLICLLLAGCATTLLVDSNVQSFSTLPALPAGATYRFERLPSQQAAGAAQAELEAMAEPALAHVGLQRDDAHPRYGVEVGARVEPMLSPWAYAWGPGWGWGWRGFWGPPPEPPWYHRRVSVVIRDLHDHQVVYETRAVHDGPWPDSRRILPVMFAAALEGFPTPPSGARQVDIRIPR
ncbi:MAG: putative lipoprotein transmembrane [Burkholderiaceae bacterium]|jgi:hypothetical protein|nr:MAG: putative lipoprotein transmembrane [Burkholderiaceae bacterium]